MYKLVKYVLLLIIIANIWGEHSNISICVSTFD